MNRTVFVALDYLVELFMNTCLWFVLMLTESIVYLFFPLVEYIA